VKAASAEWSIGSASGWQNVLAKAGGRGRSCARMMPTARCYNGQVKLNGDTLALARQFCGVAEYPERADKISPAVS
jgi:hypothetical protein